MLSRSSALGWLAANLFFLAFIGLAAGLLWLSGALLWALGLPPDDHPNLAMLGALASLVATWLIGRAAFRLLEGRRRAR